MLDFYLATALKLFFILTPFFVMSTFISMTIDFSEKERLKIAIHTTLAIALISFFLYFFGNYFFKVFGITLDAFRIGAGGLLFVTALSMARGQDKYHADNQGKDIAFVPLAIPMTVGPGTIGFLLIAGADANNVKFQIVGSLAILSVLFVLGLLLVGAAMAGRFIHRNILSVINRLTALIIASLASQFIFTGIKNIMLP